MKSITRKAFGKINLALDVVGKREDGYHLVRMVMQTVGIYDTVTVTRSEETGVRLHLEGDCADLTDGSDNLAVRAAETMIREFNIRDGFDITLDKKIPIAAGMAGGSADAAAVITGIRDMYGLWAGNTRLQEIGATLGADVPFCIEGGMRVCEGIGEKITVLPDWMKCSLVLVKPDIAVSTAWVYKAFDGIPEDEIVHPDVDGMVAAIRKRNLKGMASLCGNVLEEKTGAEYSVIGELETFLKEQGALNAIMTGSGPTVFGIFESKKTAEKALAALEEKYPAYWRCLTGFVNQERENL